MHSNAIPTQIIRWPWVFPSLCRPGRRAARIHGSGKRPVGVFGERLFLQFRFLGFGICRSSGVVEWEHLKAVPTVGYMHTYPYLWGREMGLRETNDYLTLIRYRNKENTDSLTSSTEDQQSYEWEIRGKSFLPFRSRTLLNFERFLVNFWGVFWVD